MEISVKKCYFFNSQLSNLYLLYILRTHWIRPRSVLPLIVDAAAINLLPNVITESARGHQETNLSFELIKSRTDHVRPSACFCLLIRQDNRHLGVAWCNYFVAATHFYWFRGLVLYDKLNLWCGCWYFESYYIGRTNTRQENKLIS